MQPRDFADWEIWRQHTKWNPWQNATLSKNRKFLQTFASRKLMYFKQIQILVAKAVIFSISHFEAEDRALSSA